LKVHFFDELDGIDEDIKQLLNCRLVIAKKEAEFELCKKSVLIVELEETVKKYKSLVPEQYQLLELSLP